MKTAATNAKASADADAYIPAPPGCSLAKVSGSKVLNVFWRDPAGTDANGRDYATGSRAFRMVCKLKALSSDGTYHGGSLSDSAQVRDDDMLAAPLRNMQASLKFCSSNCVEGVSQLFSWVSGLGAYLGAVGTGLTAALDGDASTCATVSGQKSITLSTKTTQGGFSTRLLPVYKVRLYGAGLFNSTTVTLRDYSGGGSTGKLCQAADMVDEELGYVIYNCDTENAGFPFQTGVLLLGSSVDTRTYKLCEVELYAGSDKL